MARKPQNSNGADNSDNNEDDTLDVSQQAMENMGLSEDEDVLGDEDLGGEQQVGEQDDDGVADLLSDLLGEDEQDVTRVTTTKKGKGQEQQQQQPQRRQQQQQPQRPQRYSKDDKGNLVDPKTGQVLAKAGAEARLYERATRAELQNYRAAVDREELVTAFRRALDIGKDLKTKLDAHISASGLAGQLKLSPQEQTEALQLWAKMRGGGQGAIDGLKTILTRMATAGIDVSNLGVSGGQDVSAITALIKEQLDPLIKPLKDRQEQERIQGEEQEQQQREYRQLASHVLGFFEQTPEALPYANQIAKALRDPRLKGWTPREVWQQIQLARRSQPGNQDQRGGSPRFRQNMPRGRRAPPQGFDANRSAKTSTSYETLVDEILDVAGFDA